MPRYQEILSYHELCHREGLSLQKGMNFRVRAGKAGYSIILMSVRKNAPYQDQWHEDRGLLEYEGHDAKRGSCPDPKKADQPLTLPSGKPTDNGKFYDAALAAKSGKADPEPVQVYEKIADGIWCDRGRHLLVDAEIKTVPLRAIEVGSSDLDAPRRTRSPRTRQVLRFYLKPTTTPAAITREDQRELSINRQIPTAIKVAVWKRDNGRCVKCNATDNLHFDHDVPYSKGGSSITLENVKLLCARHNLEKSDKILSLGPLLGPLIAAAIASMTRGA